jgi:hypothetical protein
VFVLFAELFDLHGKTFVVAFGLEFRFAQRLQMIVDFVQLLLVFAFKQRRRLFILFLRVLDLLLQIGYLLS